MSWLSYLVALVVAPLLPGLINKLKALFAGRRGAPLLQLYSDLWKLLRKETVQSNELSALGRLTPAVLVGSSAIALAIVPLQGPALLTFNGDFIALVYVLVLSRLLLVFAALDTGSSFQGMGASRELLISVLSEGALLLALIVLVLATRELALGRIVSSGLASNPGVMPALVLVFVVFFLVALAENARIPFDDPNTHLELTMIHEVMVLDYSGPDFAGVLYAGALKLLVFTTLLARVALMIVAVQSLIALLLAIAGVALLIAATESLTARIRLLHIPHVLGMATAMAVLALLLTLA